MKRAWQLVTGHFAIYRRLEPWPFFWRMTLEGVAVPWLLAELIGRLAGLGPGSPFLPRDVPKYLLIAIVAGPLWELVLMQWLPVMIARRLQVRFWNQVWISLVVFFLPHLGNGWWSGIKGGLFGGFYCVFTYVCWREKSLWQACYLTYTLHALHNAIVIAIWWWRTAG